MFAHRSDIGRRDRPRGLGQPERSLKASATTQQTALPLPATGDQTGERGKPANDRENPGRLIEGEMPEPRERPGKQCKPRIPAAKGRDTELN
jgi:hypothetical protein